MLPGWGLSQRLSRRIGIARAKEISLSGNALAAERAYEWGLVNRVVAPESLVEAACDLARDMASCVPEVVTGYKRLIDRGAAMSFDDAMRFEFEAGVESAKRIDSSQIAARREGVIDRGRKQ